MERLYQCIKNKKVNHSNAREAIYRVLLENKERCLSVSDIQKELAEAYVGKVSLNTIYRHLDLFVSCNLTVMLQDDFKRAYYCLSDEGSMVFSICKQCKRIDKMKYDPNLCTLPLESADFITIHKKCEGCSR